MVQRLTIAPGEDDVFDKVVRTGQSQHVRFVQWETADECARDSSTCSSMSSAMEPLKGR